MEDFNKFLHVLGQLPLDPSALTEYRQAIAISRALKGEELATIAKDLSISKKSLSQKTESVQKSGLAGLIKSIDDLLDPKVVQRRKMGIAQMILGTLAERQFVIVSEQITGGRHLSFEDHVQSRSDTDYLLKNGGGNPVCRMNIKFHGTLFRDARELVNLEPEDCFALATYKIAGALQRQEREALPYVFLVLSIPNLSAQSVAAYVPEDFVWLLSVLGGRRKVEEAIATELGRPEHADQFQGILSRIGQGEFRIISARRAYKLMVDRMFERVFALRVRRFNMSYRNAEIDMHFSISQDLTPLTSFLEMLARDSVHVLNVRLDRGEI